MIEIENTQIPPESYIYHANIITVGRFPKCDLIIDEKKSLPYHLTLTNKKNGLYGTNIKSSLCLCNGKRFSGNKMLKKEDLISIGDTTLKIKDFSFDLNTTDPQTFPELYKNALQENPELDIILEALQKELMELMKSHV